MEEIYQIPVTYEMYGIVGVRAKSLKQAKQMVVEQERTPEESFYVDSSIEVNEEFLEFLMSEKQR